MGIVLGPNKLIGIEIFYVEEQKPPFNFSRLYFIHSKEDMEKWKNKGYKLQSEISQLPTTEPSKPGMPVQQQPDNTKIIHKVTTEWSRLSWKDQNNILSKSLKTMTGSDGGTHTELDAILYRDMKLKTCLKRWDLKDDDGKPVALDSTTIDNLMPEIAMELISAFEQVTEAGSDELKN
jgi:hypothetical protein